MSSLGQSHANWRKSSRSSTNGGECVEVAGLSGEIGVRDSKDPDGPKLAFTPAQWATFLSEAKSGTHDA